MTAETIRRIVLIGCSKQKRYTRDPKRGGRVTPKELYTGPLFLKRVEYAESRFLPWFVLSAELGLWAACQERNPTIRLHQHGDEPQVYDTSMDNLDGAYRATWAVGVAKDIVEELWEPWHMRDQQSWIQPENLVVEIHAGKDYAQPLATILQAVGVRVELPCEGLGIGEQLALYTSGRLASAERVA